MSREGMLEKLFERLFRGLVYPQIWEDPGVDLEALALTPDCHVVTIASGGCNVLSYLTADPARITAVDLNRAHVALNRLKLAAAQPPAVHGGLLPLLRRGRRAPIRAPTTATSRRISMPRRRAYWEGRSLHRGGRRRIAIFARNFYRHGLLGRFIGAAHVAARVYGVDSAQAAGRANASRSSALLRHRAGAAVRQAGRALGDVEHACRSSASASRRRSTRRWPAAGDMARGAARPARAARLRLPASTTTTSPGRPSAAAMRATPGGPLPPYLDSENFRRRCAARDRVERACTARSPNISRASPPARVDRYVLLDAQDWMTDAQLNALWTRDHPHGARRARA